ncbi:MAG: DUF6588 family protein [Bacteroidota bacterium]|jgi:hypothetical protein
MSKRFLGVASCILLFPLIAFSQQTQTGSNDLQGSLDKLSSDAAKQYVAPVVTGFGSDLNAGWFHRAPTATSFKFDLEFGVVAMGTVFTDANKTFSTKGAFQFTSDQAGMLVDQVNDPSYASLPPTYKSQARTQIINQIIGQSFTVGISGPTIIGSDKDSVKIGFKGGQFNFTDPLGGQHTVSVPSNNIALPVTGLLGDKKILGKNMVPLGAPQLSLGTIFGTQFTFRYLPDYQINSEIGKTKYFGWGIQHNPLVWFPGDFPVDLCASFFSQKLNAGTIFEAKTTSFGANASKRLGWGALNLTPYVGYMIEKSSMTFTYDYTLDTPTGKVPQHIVFDLEGENKSRLTIGLSIKVLIVNVNADYNFGTYNSFSAGVMIII